MTEAKGKKKKKILILATNPINTARLRLDKEVREIEEGLRRSKYRDRFEIKSKWAITFRDMRRAMLDYKPDIVHFCGHGEKAGLMIEDENGNAILINTDMLAGFFELFAGQVKCVLLNACYSELQAKAIRQYIDSVYGLAGAIEHESAIEFAVAFYDALGAGKTFEVAYEFAVNAIHMQNVPVGKSKVFLSHSHIDKVLHAEHLAKDLKKYGMKVWYDSWSILPGDLFLQKISKGIRECDYFVILLTHHSVKSRWVQIELGMAIDRCNQEGTQIIPVIMDECSIPDFLKSFISVDFRKGYISGLKELLRLMGIKSPVFSESEKIKLVLTTFSSKQQKYINKYILSGRLTKEQVIRQIKRKKSLYSVLGVLVIVYAYTGNLSHLFAGFGQLVKYGIPIGLLILGISIMETYSNSKHAVERYYRLLSRYEALGADIDPDIHIKAPENLFCEFLEEYDKRIFEKYRVKDNDMEKSLAICKRKYSKLGRLTLIIFSGLFIIPNLLSIESNVINFLLTLTVFGGIYLVFEYSSKKTRIKEMYELKKDFEMTMKSFIDEDNRPSDQKRRPIRILA